MTYSNKRTFSHSTVFHHCRFCNCEENFKDKNKQTNKQTKLLQKKWVFSDEEAKGIHNVKCPVFFDSCTEGCDCCYFFFHVSNCKVRGTGFNLSFIWISKLKWYIEMWKILFEQSCISRFPEIEGEIDFIFSHSTLIADLKNLRT